MKIPKYIKELMERSTYRFEDCNQFKCEPGYMIQIKKYSHYEYASTFRKEIERLQNWVNKQFGGECIVCHVPMQTVHKHMQYAVVIIYDPVMKHIENFIKE